MSLKDYAVMPYSDYEGACEAIREKDGSSAPIKSGDLRSKILGIKTGADVSAVTATASDVRDGKIFIAANGLPTEGTMPAATQATPNISVNSSGLITASATQSEGYVSSGTKSATKQLTTQGAKTITPGTSNQTAVSSGRYTTGAITVKGDSNLKAENIKSGVSIFGVNGSAKSAEIITGTVRASSTTNLTITNSKIQASSKISFILEASNANRNNPYLMYNMPSSAADGRVFISNGNGGTRYDFSNIMSKSGISITIAAGSISFSHSLSASTFSFNTSYLFYYTLIIE